MSAFHIEPSQRSSSDGAAIFALEPRFTQQRSCELPLSHHSLWSVPTASPSGLFLTIVWLLIIISFMPKRRSTTTVQLLLLLHPTMKYPNLFNFFSIFFRLQAVKRSSLMSLALPLDDAVDEGCQQGTLECFDWVATPASVEELGTGVRWCVGFGRFFRIQRDF